MEKGTGPAGEWRTFWYYFMSIGQRFVIFPSTVLRSSGRFFDISHLAVSRTPHCPCRSPQAWFLLNTKSDKLRRWTMWFPYCNHHVTHNAPAAASNMEGSPLALLHALTSAHHFPGNQSIDTLAAFFVILSIIRRSRVVGVLFHCDYTTMAPDLLAVIQRVPLYDWLRIMDRKYTHDTYCCCGRTAHAMQFAGQLNTHFRRGTTK